MRPVYGHLKTAATPREMSGRLLRRVQVYVQAFNHYTSVTIILTVGPSNQLINGAGYIKVHTFGCIPLIVLFDL